MTDDRPTHEFVIGNDNGAIVVTVITNGDPSSLRLFAGHSSDDPVSFELPEYRQFSQPDPTVNEFIVTNGDTPWTIRPMEYPPVFKFELRENSVIVIRPTNLTPKGEV